MKNQNQNINETILKWLQNASKCKFWNSDFNARLISVVESHLGHVVKGIRGPRYETGKQNPCQHFDKMPVKLLPNSASYTSRKNQLSWIDLMFGDHFRMFKEGCEIVGWNNTGSNNYIRYMFNRLGHLRDKKHNHEYWRVALYLLNNPVYQAMAFNHVHSDWYNRMTMSQVRKILQELKDISEERRLKIDYKRVYIPKPNGKLRPLGVPSPAWRVYLHMWNNFIVWFRIGNEGNQHAYFPGRSIETAWKEIIQKLESSPNLYEFDLREFFPSVDLRHNRTQLINSGVPEKVSDYLFNLNKSIVKLTPDDRMDESSYREVLYDSDWTINPNLSDDIKRELTGENPRNSPTVDKYLKMGYSLQRLYGVPQGASTSCGISTMNLFGLFNRIKNLLMYADDGLVFPENDKTPNLSDKAAGIDQNLEKSGWVKKENIWLKSLKFLGLRYIPSETPDPSTGLSLPYAVIRGDTRSGSSLEFDVLRQFQCYVLSKYDEYLQWFLKLTENMRKENRVALMETLLQNKKKQSCGEWLSTLAENFMALPECERLSLLFNTKAGSRMIASIFNGKWQLNEPCLTSLEFNKGSWIHKEWGNYMYNCSIEVIRSTLKNKLAHVERLEEEKFEEDSISSEKEFIQKRKEKLIELLDYINEFGLEAYYMESSLVDLGRCSLFKWRKDWLSSEVIKLSSDEKTLMLFHREMWKKIYIELKINLYNASTYACNDLVFWISHPTFRKKESGKILYSRFLNSYSIGIKQARELFELSKTKRKRNIFRKLRKEGRNML